MIVEHTAAGSASVFGVSNEKPIHSVERCVSSAILSSIPDSGMFWGPLRRRQSSTKDRVIENNAKHHGISSR